MCCVVENYQEEDGVKVRSPDYKQLAFGHIEPAFAC